MRDRSPARRALFLFVVAAASFTVPACVLVKPYERQVLSLRCMSADGEAAESKFRQHWQESREGSLGGLGVGGGGCGCN